MPVLGFFGCRSENSWDAILCLITFAGSFYIPDVGSFRVLSWREYGQESDIFEVYGNDRNEENVFEKTFILKVSHARRQKTDPVNGNYRYLLCLFR